MASFAAVGAFQDALRAQGYAGVMTNLVQYGPALATPATVAAPFRCAAYTRV